MMEGMVKVFFEQYKAAKAYKKNKNCIDIPHK
jgi:hypothetical protein